MDNAISINEIVKALGSMQLQLMLLQKQNAELKQKIAILTQEKKDAEHDE